MIGSVTQMMTIVSQMMSIITIAVWVSGISKVAIVQPGVSLGVGGGLSGGLGNGLGLSLLNSGHSGLLGGGGGGSHGDYAISVGAGDKF